MYAVIGVYASLRLRTERFKFWDMHALTLPVLARHKIYLQLLHGWSYIDIKSCFNGSDTLIDHLSRIQRSREKKEQESQQGLFLLLFDSSKAHCIQLFLLIYIERYEA